MIFNYMDHACIYIYIYIWARVGGPTSPGQVMVHGVDPRMVEVIPPPPVVVILYYSIV